MMGGERGEKSEEEGGKEREKRVMIRGEEGGERGRSRGSVENDERRGREGRGGG